MEMKNDLGAALGRAMQEAVRLHRSGHFDAAEALYRRVLAQHRTNFDALHLLGVCRHQRGDFAGAEKHVRAALKVKPDAAAAHVSLGNALRELDRLADAVQCYRRASMIDPVLEIAHYNLGTALEEAGRYSEAISAYERALEQRFSAAARSGRGNCRFALGRIDEAIEDYLAAVDLDPAFADAQANLAGALLRRQRFDEARAAADRALAAQPAHAGAALNRALVLDELNLGDEALVAIEQALAKLPADAEVLFQRGRALVGLRRHAAAVSLLRRALQLRPEHWYARVELAGAMAGAGELDGAAQLYEGLLRDRPDDPHARFNSGLTAFWRGDFARARADMEAGLAIEPALPTGRMNLSQLYLLEGRFDEGWRLYEGRWEMRELRALRRDFAQPLWLGESEIGASTILVHAEQGMGDIVQFARYVPMLAARAARVVFEVPVALATLVCRAMPPTVEVVARGRPLPAFDLQCPLMSLPMVFGTRLETIPPTGGCFTPDPARVELWRERLGEGAALRVGLAWSGSAGHRHDRARSVPLQMLRDLVERVCAGRRRVQFVGLQNDLRDDDREALAQMPALQYFGEAIEDFDDTAALASLCDLVISVDSAPAHVAGALGKPVWLLLAFVPDWRWQLGRADSPWYPSARLFRQDRRGDWLSVVARVADELDGVAGLGMGAASSGRGRQAGDAGSLRNLEAISE